MPSLWFVVPASGRAQLARICLRQLRRTCDALTEHGVEATAVVIADDENLDTARELGFGTVRRDNLFVSRRFNDGIQLALERPLPPRPREETHGEYLVTGAREYRGNKPGSTFHANLDRNAEGRAIRRGDIELLRMVAPSLEPGSYTLPDGWVARNAADYVVPIGSDDWIDWRILLPLPDAQTMVAFRLLSFVREDGGEMVSRRLDNAGGCGIRVYPRNVMRSLRFRPADECRARGCDTSILNNLQAARPFRIVDREIDPRQIVDWKTPAEQLNPYETLRRHREVETFDDPFDALADIYPAESLAEMADHYGRHKPPERELALAGHAPRTHGAPEGALLIGEE